MVQFKPGVSVYGIQKEIIQIIAIINTYFELRMRKEFVITSCTDGKHMKNSKHYSGFAIDIRICHLSAIEIDNFIAWFRSHHDENYDIVRESDHIHVEYDPH